jgi:hypothetical protein
MTMTTATRWNDVVTRLRKRLVSDLLVGLFSVGGLCVAAGTVAAALPPVRAHAVPVAATVEPLMLDGIVTYRVHETAPPAPRRMARSSKISRHAAAMTEALASRWR